MKFPEIEAAKPRRILAYSGGLDSYLVARLWPCEVLVFCSLGQRYAIREIQAINDLAANAPPHGELIFDHSLQLGPWERFSDSIIPLRNLLIAAACTRYGDTIVTGTLAGEINHDKTPDFFRAAAEVMTICYRPSYWCEGREIRFDNPASGLTKAGLIRLATERGIDPRDWSHTVSCYSPHGFCGRCGSCFKRWVAHEVNGIREDYHTPPWRSRYALEAFGKAIDGEYPSQRAAEVIAAGKIVGALD